MFNAYLLFETFARNFEFESTHSDHLEFNENVKHMLNDESQRAFVSTLIGVFCKVRVKAGRAIFFVFSQIISQKLEIQLWTIEDLCKPLGIVELTLMVKLPLNRPNTFEHKLLYCICIYLARQISFILPFGQNLTKPTFENIAFAKIEPSIVSLIRLVYY